MAQIGTKENPVHGYPIIETDNDMNGVLWIYPRALPFDGQIKAPLRWSFSQLVQDCRGTFQELASTHPSVSRNATVGEDTNAESRSHISTGARVNGGVSLGRGTFLGSGAVVNQGLTIGENCVIESGAVIPSDATEGTHVTGEWQ